MRSGRSEVGGVGRNASEPTATSRLGGQACLRAIIRATTAAWWAGGWAPVTSRRPSTTSYLRPLRVASRVVTRPAWPKPTYRRGTYPQATGFGGEGGRRLVRSTAL